MYREIAGPAPDRPAREMQREPAFNEILFEIRDIIEKLESLSESAKDSDGVP
jgi:hypothetical protein